MKIFGCMSKAIFSISIISVLTGCPGIGDRFRPPETTTVSATRDAICFQVPNSEDYQPTFIIISPRGTPYRDRNFIAQPDLTVSNGQMCIPFSFYPFPPEGQLIVEYILSSKKKREHPRSVVVAIELTRGIVAQAITMEDGEF